MRGIGVAHGYHAASINYVPGMIALAATTAKVLRRNWNGMRVPNGADRRKTQALKVELRIDKNSHFDGSRQWGTGTTQLGRLIVS
jgi:hypothetical protein